MKLTRSIANLFRLTGFALALTLCTGAAWAQQGPVLQQKPPGAIRYAVIDLGTLGGSFSLAYAINDRGQVDGFSTIPGDGAIHSFLFENKIMNDLGTLGGPNSQSFAGLNNVPQVPGSSDTSTSDPNGEDFCGFGTNLICLGFVWQNGVTTPLPTLGGNNSQAAGINDPGEVVGYAETSKADPNCPAPQVLQFRPVIWSGSHIQAFPLYPGDAEGGCVQTARGTRIPCAPHFSW
jgi:probable HAF family extracellular repeat protein